MKKRLLVLAEAALGVLLLSSASFAAGFALPDQSASAMGMAGAFTGQADDPSAVWYNPAGITQLDGTRISGGVIAIYPTLTHENTDGTTDVSKREVHLPFHLYATNRVNEKIAVGLGINNPFGLSTHWSGTSETRYVATFSDVETLNINPNVAYKVNDDVSAAVGVDYLRLRAVMENLLPPAGANFRLGGDGDGWGYNAGILYKVTNTLNLGLTYRSKIKVDVDGTADVGGGAVSKPASTSITLPDLIQFGASYKVSDNLTINANADYTRWATYDQLVIQSATFTALGLPNPHSDEKQWKDVWALRIGAQYKLSDQWKLRAGYVYDQSPVPSERFETRVPDADRQGVTLGAGYTTGNFTIDAAYMYLRFNDRTIHNSLAGGSTPVPALDGTYKSDAHLAAVTLGYKF